MGYATDQFVVYRKMTMEQVHPVIPGVAFDVVILHVSRRVGRWNNPIVISTGLTTRPRQHVD